MHMKAQRKGQRHLLQKPGSLNPIPKTYIVGRTNSPKLSSGLHKHTAAYMHTLNKCNFEKCLKKCSWFSTSYTNRIRIRALGRLLCSPLYLIIFLKEVFQNRPKLIQYVLKTRLFLVTYVSIYVYIYSCNPVQ